MFNNEARDNTYNSENDFSSQINFSIWCDEDDHNGDWCWPRGRAFIALCIHGGGDVRGNYGRTMLLDWEGADSGFLDWVLGWEVRTCPHLQEAGSTEYLDIEQIDDDTAKWIVEGSTRDERLSEEASPGYHSLPSSVLYDEAGTEDCYWFEGSAIIKKEDGSGWLVATPYHYSGCEITTPESGKKGWVCDASIDTESFIKETLGEELEGDEDDSEWLTSLWEAAMDGWDHEDAIGTLCDALSRGDE